MMQSIGPDTMWPKLALPSTQVGSNAGTPINSNSARPMLDLGALADSEFVVADLRTSTSAGESVMMGSWTHPARAWTQP